MGSDHDNNRKRDNAGGNVASPTSQFMEFVSITSFLSPDTLGHAEHAPFVFWLVDVLRPNVLVATDEGWKLLFEDVVRKLGQNACVRSASVNEAHSFGDRSIDLLQAEGELATPWIAKLSGRAVVLLAGMGTRDISVPHFEFHHGGRLTVAGYGDSPLPELTRLYAASANPELAAPTQFAYRTLGNHLAARSNDVRKREAIIERLGAELDQQRRELQQLHDTEVKRLRHESKRLTAAAEHYKSEYEQAISSRSWKLTRPLREGNGLGNKIKALFRS